MPTNDLRVALAAAEQAAPEEQRVLLAFLAGRSVELEERERNAALRRSQLLLAAGGDPRRPLELYGRAVTALAGDLDRPTSRAQLAEGLGALIPAAEGLETISRSLHELARDADLAWQCYAMALLAEELAGED